MVPRIRNKEDLESVGLHPCGGLNLRRADLTGARLAGADLTGARLAGADLAGADLSGANFTGASLPGANLTGANLRGADFWGANLLRVDLRGACLEEANLMGARFWGAHLCQVYFRGAWLDGAHLGGADLRGARFAGAHLDWESHTLIAAVLIEAAFGDKEKILAANFIQYRPSRCWEDFVLEGSFGRFEYLKPWVISVLKQYDGFVDRVFDAYTAS